MPDMIAHAPMLLLLLEVMLVLLVEEMHCLKLAVHRDKHDGGKCARRLVLKAVAAGDSKAKLSLCIR